MIPEPVLWVIGGVLLIAAVLILAADDDDWPGMRPAPKGGY